MVNGINGLDWHINRNALLALLGVILCGAAVLWVLAVTAEDLRLVEHQAKIQLQQAGQRLSTAQENYNYVKSFYDQYQQLTANGVIADEDRLQWIDAVREVADTIKIPHMDYQLNPQREYMPGPATSPAGGVRVYFSPMYLKLNLLHEGDLIAFMSRLEQQAKGLFDIDFCKLERRSEKLVYQAEATNISASCDIRWFTIGKVS